MNAERFRELLDEKAEALASDISGDHPGLDVSYESYVFEPSSSNGIARIIGYVYMGETGDWAFTVDESGAGIEDNHAVLLFARKLSPYGDLL